MNNRVHPVRLSQDRSRVSPARYLVQRWHIRYHSVVLAVTLSCSFLYIAALLSSPTSTHDSTSWKLLLGYVILSLLDAFYRFIHIVRLQAFLTRYGEGETNELPHPRLRIFDILSHASSGTFVLSCWITHLAFPFQSCPDADYKLICNALHVISLIFLIWVSMAIGTVIAGMFYCFHRILYTERSRWMREEQIPNQQVLAGGELWRIAFVHGARTQYEESMARRRELIASLPESFEPPIDGDVCGVCLDDANTDLTWRILPCGHRFHSQCVDPWLLRPEGACPSCRKDPAAAINSSVPPDGRQEVDTLPSSQTSLAVAAEGPLPPDAAASAPASSEIQAVTEPAELPRDQNDSGNRVTAGLADTERESSA